HRVACRGLGKRLDRGVVLRRRERDLPRRHQSRAALRHRSERVDHEGHRRGRRLLGPGHPSGRREELGAPKLLKLCLACDRTFSGDGWRCPACGWEPVTNAFVEFAPAAEAADAMEQEGFEHLPDIEAKSFWFRSRNRLISWALRRYFPKARSLLEVGCGTGFVLAGLHREVPGLELAGGELSHAGLVTARRRLPGAQLYQMDACSIPFEDEFDVVGAFDVLEHVDDDEAAL